MDDGGEAAGGGGTESPPEIKSQADGYMVIEQSLDGILASLRQRIKFTCLAVSDRFSAFNFNTLFKYEIQ